MKSWILGALLALSVPALADVVKLQQPLPTLSVDARGELLVDGEDVRFQPWQAGGVGKVQVLQYIPATTKGSKIFEPVTDALRDALEPGSYHVTTVLNVDAALWGTGGLVTSSAADSKRDYPKSTMVLDDDAAVGKALGVKGKGAALIILDAVGVVHYYTTQALEGAALQQQVDLVRSLQ